MSGCLNEEQVKSSETIKLTSETIVILTEFVSLFQTKIKVSVKLAFKASQILVSAKNYHFNVLLIKRP